ncbi:MAG TPA: CoA pyrophosphatase [Dehalococcoidia bacterium]|nr:CoA pyrophosphatase [Dehalococcoidia bacterium]
MLDEIKSRLEAYRPVRIDPAGLPLAAVMVPLYDHRGGLHVVFTKRTDRVQHHRGEISFPGGAVEPEDADPLDAALRECHEEIGLLAEHIEVIGQLDDIVTVSRFHVSVYVGAIGSRHVPYVWHPHEHEVAEVLEVPLLHLLDTANVVEVPRQRDGHLVLMEGFKFGEHIIWGATGRMLRNFLDVAAFDFGKAKTT